MSPKRRPKGDEITFTFDARLDAKDAMPKCVSAAPFEKTRPGSGTFHVLPMRPQG